MDPVEQALQLKRGETRMLTMKWEDGSSRDAVMTVTRIDRKNKKIWFKNRELNHACFVQFN